MLLLGTLVVVVIVACVVVALVVVCSICCNCAATFCAHWENVRNATPLLAGSLCECVDECACVCVWHILLRYFRYFAHISMVSQ